MKILYVHGFGSKYDPTHDKIVKLSSLGEVVGVNVDYTLGYDAVLNKIVDTAEIEQVDLIVGTSMGGYMAANAGARSGIPFVAINPAVTPSETLSKWVGNFVDHYGNDHSLREDVALAYPDISMDGNGIVLLDLADEVISATKTRNMLDGVYSVFVFEGGNHRFAHMDKALPLIKEFYHGDK